MQSRGDQNQSPPGFVDLSNWCNNMCRTCFFIYILSYILGGAFPAMIYSFASKLFMDDSNINKYDFQEAFSSNYGVKMQTPLLNMNYFVN